MPLPDFLLTTQHAGLFESDTDIDIAVEISLPAKEGHEELCLSKLIHQTDMLAGQDARDYYKSEEYTVILKNLITECRERLDSGDGDRLFDEYRAKENKIEFMRSGKYILIIVGALMMRAGAKIRQADLDHLRSIIPDIPSRSTYALPICDEGFRDPGKIQFLTALDNYRAGVPRSFQTPSCFQCGKINQDIGEELLKCSRCKYAWYCNRVRTISHMRY